MDHKRLHITCAKEVFEKIESLKSLLHIKRDEVIEIAISSLFKKEIAKIAVKEGLLGTTPIVELSRSHFEEQDQKATFDDICDLLNLKGQDGRVSSIDSIQLEIQNAYTKDNC